MVAESPTLVVEVSSPGKSSVDTTDKLDEYREYPGVQLIMFVEPSRVLVKLYRRDSKGAWGSEKYDDLASVIDMPEIGASLALSQIYATLTPRDRPRLQLIGEDQRWKTALISEPKQRQRLVARATQWGRKGLAAEDFSTEHICERA
jgi:hypothetical protein